MDHAGAFNADFGLAVGVEDTEVGLDATLHVIASVSGTAGVSRALEGHDSTAALGSGVADNTLASGVLDTGAVHRSKLAAFGRVTAGDFDAGVTVSLGSAVSDVLVGDIAHLVNAGSLHALVVVASGGADVAEGIIDDLALTILVTLLLLALIRAVALEGSVHATAVRGITTTSRLEVGVNELAGRGRADLRGGRARVGVDVALEVLSALVVTDGAGNWSNHTATRSSGVANELSARINEERRVANDIIIDAATFLNLTTTEGLAGVGGLRADLFGSLGASLGENVGTESLVADVVGGADTLAVGRGGDLTAVGVDVASEVLATSSQALARHSYAALFDGGILHPVVAGRRSAAVDLVLGTAALDSDVAASVGVAVVGGSAVGEDGLRALTFNTVSLDADVVDETVVITRAVSTRVDDALANGVGLEIAVALKSFASGRAAHVGHLDAATRMS